MLSLVNADSISSENDELVVQKLLPEGRIDAEAAALARQRMESWPLYRGVLVSEDGRLATIVLTLSSSDADVSLSIDAALRDLVKASARSGFTTYVDGEPIITTRITQAMRGDVLLLLPLVLFVVIAILWLCFRNPAGVVDDDPNTRIPKQRGNVRKRRQKRHVTGIDLDDGQAFDLRTIGEHLCPGPGG